MYVFGAANDVKNDILKLSMLGRQENDQNVQPTIPRGKRIRGRNHGLGVRAADDWATSINLSLLLANAMLSPILTGHTSCSHSLSPHVSSCLRIIPTAPGISFVIASAFHMPGTASVTPCSMYSITNLTWPGLCTSYRPLSMIGSPEADISNRDQPWEDYIGRKTGFRLYESDIPSLVTNTFLTLTNRRTFWHH